jgi:alpha-beta hydrolase superfamily lysophospholipase
MSYKTDYLKVTPDFSLAYVKEIVKDSKATVVIVPGFTEHKGRYFEFIDKLVNAKFNVFAFDLRGHGESGGKKGYVKDFPTFINDLKYFLEFVKSQVANKIVLFGHSLGGLISSSYVSIYNDVDLLILSSPEITSQPKYKYLHYLPYKLMGNFYVKKRFSESDDMLDLSLHDPFSLTHFTVKLCGVMIIQGKKFIDSNIQNIQVPTILIAGELDNLVVIQELPAMFNKIASNDKILKIYPDLLHRLIQSKKSDEVINDVINWLQEKI